MIIKCEQNQGLVLQMRAFVNLTFSVTYSCVVILEIVSSKKNIRIKKKMFYLNLTSENERLVKSKPEEVQFKVWSKPHKRCNNHVE